MNPRPIRWFWPPVLAGLILAALPAAGATPADPRQTVQTATDEILAIIYDLPADGRPLAVRLRPVMEKYFDFELLTRRAVGPGWRQLTPAQQERTTRLLSELIVRSYCARFNTAVRSRVAVAAPVALAAGRCELPTTFTHAGRNITVAYRAEQMPDGWRFYDVIVEGVSLVANYRAQFAALFQKGGADAIIGALERNLAETPLA